VRPLGLGWANLVSVGRILLAPVLVVLVLPGGRAPAYLAAVLFVVGAVSDGVDGYLARRYETTTRLGQWLDPLADKVLVTAPIAALTVVGRFPLWAAVLIAVREFAVSLLRAWLGTRGLAMPASWWGKVKTAAQMLVVLLYLLPDLGTAVEGARFWVLVVAVVLTVLSGLDYFVRGFRPARAGAT
jgi:CDP-diacylglycerol---glycerol-3-phosphate 3-phosphatidyltransferase